METKRNSWWPVNEIGLAIGSLTDGLKVVSKSVL
jgi:hypothetical protein